TAVQAPAGGGMRLHRKPGDELRGASGTGPSATPNPGSRLRWPGAVQPPRDDLGQVAHLERLLGVEPLDPVLEHGDAERAGHRYPARSRLDRLAQPVVADTAAALLLHEGARPARPA